MMASDRAPPLAGADAVRSFVKRYVETHREHLMGIARPIVASRDEAEDAVQEGALRVLRRGLAGGLIHSGSIPTAVLNAARDLWRRRKSRSRVRARYARERENDSAAAVDPVRRERKQRAAEVVAAVLATLSEAEREAFVAHDIHGLEYAEMAEDLGKPVKTLRQEAYRGRKRFEAYLRAQGFNSLDDVR